jgi:hypothetical protein
LNVKRCNARERRGLDALQKPGEVGGIGLEGPFGAVAYSPGEQKRFYGILEVSIGFLIG